MSPLSPQARSALRLHRTFFTGQPCARSTITSSPFRPFIRHLTAGPPTDTFWRDIKLKKALIWSCIAANSAVYLAWYSTSQPSSSPLDLQKKQSTLRYLYDNFTLSERNVREGRWWITVMSAFSHMDFWHLAVNMITFQQIGQFLVYTPGVKAGRHLLPLILGSAFAGGAAFLSHGSASPSSPPSSASSSNSKGFGFADLFRRDPYSSPRPERIGLGFSGVVSAVITAAACLHPYQKILLFGIVPLPLWAAGLGFVAYDTWAMDQDQKGRKAGGRSVAHDAHIGGAVFGGAFYVLVLRRFGGILGRRP